MEYANNNGYLCTIGGQGGFLPERGTGLRWTTGQVEGQFAGDSGITDTQDGGDRGSTELPTKDDLVAWRLWDPGLDVPSGLSGTEGTGLHGGIIWSWTDDGDIPTIDSNWARDDVECELEIHTNSSFTNLVDTEYTNYGVGTRTWVDAGATPGNRYYGRIRYRNKTDTSLVGSWEEDTTGAIYGEGTTKT